MSPLLLKGFPVRSVSSGTSLIGMNFGKISSLSSSINGRVIKTYHGKGFCVDSGLLLTVVSVGCSSAGLFSSSKWSFGLILAGLTIYGINVAMGPTNTKICLTIEEKGKNSASKFTVALKDKT